MQDRTKLLSLNMSIKLSKHMQTTGYAETDRDNKETDNETDKKTHTKREQCISTDSNVRDDVCLLLCF